MTILTSQQYYDRELSGAYFNTDMANTVASWYVSAGYQDRGLLALSQDTYTDDDLSLVRDRVITLLHESLNPAENMHPDDRNALIRLLAWIQGRIT